MANVQDLRESTFREFKDVLSDATVTGLCGRRYVRVTKLIEWMESDAELRRVEILLDYAYPNRPTPQPPLGAEDICKGQDSCALVFSILLELDHGELIDLFEKRGLRDSRLPISLAELKEKAPSIAEDFNRKQWAFCPANFDYSYSSQIYHRDRIIPICKQLQINDKGGTAQLWQIVVREEFVKPRLRERVPKSKFTDDEFGECYQFALKIFREGHKQRFENEKNAFMALRKHEGIIRYLSNYEHPIKVLKAKNIAAREGLEAETKTKVTYNILLEFGELDLDKYFEGYLPPVLEGEVSDFWKDMFDVANAVKGIHDVKISTGGMQQEYYGWHADIKPDNILIVKSKFKLADPGFARFEKKTGKDATIIQGGTTTYGAPECHPSRDYRTPVRRTIDIWSLGCVFSIAATWVVLGYEGIRQFSRFRDNAIRKIVDQRKAQAIGSEETNFVKGDFFHDGTDVLTDIRDWHNFLRRYLRQTDTITSQVLDLVENQMLKGAAEERIEAKALCTRLQDILTRYQNPEQPRQKLLGSIMQVLFQVDEEAPTRPGASRQQPAGRLVPPTSQESRTSKSQQLDLPLMKTTHRSEYLKSALRTEGIAFEADAFRNKSNTGQPPNLHAFQQSQDLQARFNAVSLRARQKKDLTGPAHNLTSHHRTDTLTLNRSATEITAFRQASGQRKHQDVFQTREEIQKNKSRILGKTRKDEFLKGYFNNRDIKFLVDNAETMGVHWAHAKFLLETLVMKAYGLDKNGMDLSFTYGEVALEDNKDEAKFRKKMEEQEAQPVAGWHTDMSRSLEDILFTKYLAECRKDSADKVKKLTLIILTDGIWQGMRDREGVDRVIMDFANEMEKIPGFTLRKRERRVSIEFVQFGYDVDATARLRRLDDDLPYEGVPDIVDTEHCTGDVNKMLLGSFIEEFDAEDETIQSPPRTPSRGNSYRASKSPPESQTPTFAHLAQRPSLQNTDLSSEMPQIYPRISQTHRGSDSSGRRPEKQHKLPSFSYSGH